MKNLEIHRKLGITFVLFLFSSTVFSGEPLVISKNSSIYQRILSLPKAELLGQPNSVGSVVVKSVPPFTLFYVFERKIVDGDEWLRVSDTVNWVAKKNNAHWQGWLQINQTQEWKNMLVLQFKAKGQRERVLFFKNKNDLKSLVNARGVEVKAAKFYRTVESGNPHKILAAIEPEAAIGADNKYLMPILGWKKNVSFKNGAETTLVEIASLNEAGKSDVMDEGLGSIAPELTNLKVGIVFVLDTTSSMGPYIEQVKKMIKGIHTQLTNAPFGEKIHYGVVGYRDSLKAGSGVDYVTKVYHPLDGAQDKNHLFRSLDNIQVSKTSTIDWREDAYAGIYETLKADWWDSFDARFVVVVSDAGARAGADPLAKYSNIDAITLKELARGKKITLFPMYMKSKSAQDKGDVDQANKQYRKLGETGDEFQNKLLIVPAGDLRAFKQQLDGFSLGLTTTLGVWFDSERIGKQPAIKKGNGMVAIVRNELARVELEYIGNSRKQMAPLFYKAWAADKDLINSKRSMFDINIMLTRSQLSDLAQRVGILLNSLKTTTLSASGFMEKLQGLSASMSIDPLNKGKKTSVVNMLPEFLENLPYKSAVLQLDENQWMAMAEMQRGDFIDDLQDKLEAYQLIEEDQSRWVNLSAGAVKGRDFALVRLKLLP